MFNPQMELLTSVLRALVERLDAGSADDGGWAEARAALEATKAQEPEVARALEARDAVALRALVAEWASGKRLLPVPDREVLARAMKAYRKSLKVTRLDAESSIGGGPMSSGRQSNILGIRPPDRYPRTVWDELVRQGRLIGGRHGLYELPPGG